MTKYELKRNDNDQVIGTVWWTGKKIETSDAKLMPMLKKIHVNGLSFKDGKDFLEALPSAFKSGYMSVRKLNE